MDIKIGDKVRFNQKGLDTPDNSKFRWAGISSMRVSEAKRLGTGTVTWIDQTLEQETFLILDFQDPNLYQYFWPAEMFEKVPEEEKLEFTQEEKKLLRELVQDKLKGYQELLDKLQ